MGIPPPGIDDPLLPERFQGRLETSRIGRRVEYRHSVGSTNDEARRLARAGAADGLVVVAEEQRAGRGRRRRPWASPAGRGIYASVVLRPDLDDPEAVAGIQLAAGIAVAEALAPRAPAPPSLRWPNDCFCSGHKLGGVLVEAESTGARLDYLVCGMGVNVNQTADEFPPELAGRAASLKSLTGRHFDRVPILVDLLASLESWDDVLRRRGLAPIRERWLELSPETDGSEVEVVVEDGRLVGRAVGLAEGGGLQVEVDDVVHVVNFGEVVRLVPRRPGS